MKYFLLLSILIATQAKAQFKIKKDWDWDVTENSFCPGRTFVGLNYSIPHLTNKYWAQYSKNGNYTISGYGPIGIIIERAVGKKLGITANYFTTNKNVQWGLTYYDTLTEQQVIYTKGFNYQSHIAAIGINQHAYIDSRLDIILGASVGYNFYTYKSYSNKANDVIEVPAQHTPLYYYLSMGARYYFTPRNALFVNLGLSTQQNLTMGYVYRMGY
jgi:hypothetical protein